MIQPTTKRAALHGSEQMAASMPPFRCIAGNPSLEATTPDTHLNAASAPGYRAWFRRPSVAPQQRPWQISCLPLSGIALIGIEAALQDLLAGSSTLDHIEQHLRSEA